MDQVDPIYQAAIAREAELWEELQKIRNFLATYRTLARGLDIEFVNKDGTQLASVDNSPSGVDASTQITASEAPPARRTRVTDNPKPALVVAAAVELIRERGRPMSRSEIHEGLKARGVVVNGADPVKTLGTMLWRSGGHELEQIEGWGYWLKHSDYEPANYYGSLV